MPNHEFIAANVASHRAELIELNAEYLAQAFAGIEELFAVSPDAVVGVPARECVPRVIDKARGDPPLRGDLRAGVRGRQFPGGRLRRPGAA